VKPSALLPGGARKGIRPGKSLHQNLLLVKSRSNWPTQVHRENGRKTISVNFMNELNVTFLFSRTFRGTRT